MNLSKASQSVLKQLAFIIDQLDDSSFSKPLVSLNYASIGQHVRHTLEFFICMFDGISSGTINYDRRERDLEIETYPKAALLKINDLESRLHGSIPDLELLLQGSYSLENEMEEFSIKTNLERELAYNIEHAVHHMALIKIGLLEVDPAIEIPTHFGVAVSTVRHQN